MRVLIAGGGTGGHLTPSLAVAQELRRRDKSGAVLIAGRKGGVAERLVAEAGVELEELQVSGLNWAQPWSVARFCVALPKEAWGARRLLRRFEADCVVGAGGYVSAPVVAAARQMGLPVVLLEQNAMPGRATRWLSRGWPRGGAIVATSFAVSARYLPGRQVVFTGNPIRSQIAVLAQQPRARGRLQNLLVTGGSQGARTLNRAVTAAAEPLLNRYPDLQITHQCGKLDHEVVESRRAQLPVPLQQRYHVAAFYDDMGERMYAADLVLMRAGASSLAEAAALGVPAVLVPYPYAGNHQRWNAAVFAKAGAAQVIADSDFGAETLLRAVAGLTQGDRLAAMAQAASKLGRPQAAAAVVDLIRSTLSEKRAA